MAIKSVAVYSDADHKAPYLQMADEIVRLGSPPLQDSYLCIEKIIKAAKDLKVDAIHPGYGFLSENSLFARTVENEGFIFIGPDAHSIEIMGNKIEAKKLMKDKQIPVIPGSNGEVLNSTQGLAWAKKLGFPVLIKAAAGGGGKGMRLLRSEESFHDLMERAISESTTSFGNGSVFIEKCLTDPRHIEIQVLSDRFGHIIHLFERECSIQRRHQKVIEEAPSPFVDNLLRKEMGQAAILVARACNYTGAGTVEFLVDKNRNFYFLEMNTRLQVEHPVTEMITGLDIVEWQIRIAQGEPLHLSQENLEMRGHAVELRIYAEDPFNQFYPSVGRLEKFKVERSDVKVRLDTGYEEGMEIPIYYDPLIAKLIVSGADRQEAISNMIVAIHSIRLEGVTTTLPFGAFTMAHPGFREGNYDIHFIESEFSPKSYRAATAELAEAASHLALEEYVKKYDEPKEMKGAGNWRNRNLIQ